LSNSPQQQQRTRPLRSDGQKGNQTTHNKRIIVYETNSKRKSWRCQYKKIVPADDQEPMRDIWTEYMPSAADAKFLTN
jgi:hypothetical protein